jgi:hypothetical protein
MVGVTWNESWVFWIEQCSAERGGGVKPESPVVGTRLLAIPGRLAQEIANENDAVKVERIVKREVADALTELSIDPRAIRSQGGSGCR